MIIQRLQKNLIVRMGRFIRLKDGRGRHKSADELSELEKLRAENRLLKAEKKRQQMEIDLLKKLEEIERR